MGIVDPAKIFPSHPTEELLEEYVFDRLSEARAAQVEEHLLICHACQDTVTGTDRFVSALKVAVRQPVPACEQVRSRWRNVLDLLPRFAVSKTSPALVLVLAILVLLVVKTDSPEPPAPVAVSLSSLRGPNPLSPAPAGKPLQLHIQAPDVAPDLTSGKQLRVELVNAAGEQVWKGEVTESDGKLVGLVPKPLGKGVYWVRLYGADSELLREFGLSVK